MDQKLGHHISNCLFRAADAKRQADLSIEPTAKDHFLTLERSWYELAQSDQFMERFERFLLDDGKRADRCWEPISRAPSDFELELAILNGDGPRSLPFPCRRVLDGWINARTERRIDIAPTHWRRWIHSS